MDTQGVPPPRYIPAHRVMAEMARFGTHRLQGTTSGQALVLAMLGGALIAGGAILSVLLADGGASPGLVRLLEGLGFSAGFFFVVLSEAVLFTEANVVIPASLLEAHRPGRDVVRFWLLAWTGNFAGALVVGGLVSIAHQLPTGAVELLGEVVERKLAFAEAGGSAVGRWGQVVLSGMLANWLVGMAAFFAMMGRTIFGKYIPVALAVTTFVAAGFQHSPANMAYFSLASAQGLGVDWGSALGWSIIPAGIGNVVGGALLVAVPLWYGLGNRQPERGAS